ncbi:Cold shock protein CspC [Rickettsiales endosymbiont of Trichoplax sp. H2]|nr:Cold shock protein CspC [Rickettsiales endosymbiont of Trichoplax sp. H2]
MLNIISNVARIVKITRIVKTIINKKKDHKMKVTGTVKWFNPEKGYGFVKQENGKDVFVHISAVKEAGLDTLDEKQKIEFEIETNQGRTSVANIKTL